MWGGGATCQPADVMQGAVWSGPCVWGLSVSTGRGVGFVSQAGRPLCRVRDGAKHRLGGMRREDRGRRRGGRGKEEPKAVLCSYGIGAAVPRCCGTVPHKRGGVEMVALALDVGQRRETLVARHSLALAIVHHAARATESLAANWAWL